MDSPVPPGRLFARRYVRQLRDVPVGGLGVVIESCIRRFRCENPACGAVTFTEQIAGLTTPHSRHTPLLGGVLTQIGLALAGRAGARLATAVGLTVGKDTLSRLVRSLPDELVSCQGVSRPPPGLSLRIHTGAGAPTAN